MGYGKILTLSLAVSFTLSCASPEPPPPKKTVFDPLLQAQARARGVQNTVDAQADAQRKATDAQEHADTTP
jgi:hypothetical protein